MDNLDRLRNQMAGYSAWSLAGISGATLGERLLENAKERRIRNAERYRNEAYRKLQHDEALGTVSGVPYNEAIKDVEKETAKRKKTRVIDYYLPALATVGGLGLGYSGYKDITKSKSASVMDKAITIKTVEFNTNLQKLQTLNAKCCR
jgi:hypothetical protein